MLTSALRHPLSARPESNLRIERPASSRRGGFRRQTDVKTCGERAYAAPLNGRRYASERNFAQKPPKKHRGRPILAGATKR